MERVYSNIFDKTGKYKPSSLTSKEIFFKSIKELAYCSFKSNMLGLQFERYIFKKFIKARLNNKIPSIQFFNQLRIPIDSVRYFEFHYGKEFVKDLSFVNILDISSPRFFPFFLSEWRKKTKVIILNPDQKDLAESKKLADIFNLDDNLTFDDNLIEDADLQNNHFDLITSLSVLEHIPLEKIPGIILKIKEKLKNDGYFLISLPISKKAFEEYIDFNEYGINTESDNGYFFGQRFHDEALIEELLIKQFGQPIKSRFISEKKEGIFFNNRFEKINNQNYPSWNEAIMFHNDFFEVRSINDLQGIGVGIYLFKK